MEAELITGNTRQREVQQFDQNLLLGPQMETLLWKLKPWRMATDRKSDALECHGTDKIAEDFQHHKHLSNGSKWGVQEKVSVANTDWKDTSENGH